MSGMGLLLILLAFSVVVVFYQAAMLVFLVYVTFGAIWLGIRCGIGWLMGRFQ